MPALPSFIMNPLWDQFSVLIPPVGDQHPLGCHRPRIADRIVFEKLIGVLVFGIAYAKIADSTCGATTIRVRRDEWIRAGLFTKLEEIALGCVPAPANRPDSPLLRPTLELLGRFNEGLGVGMPEKITVHLDAGYDSHKTRALLFELGCEGVISTKREPLQAGARWVVERTNSWHNRGFKKLAICTEVRTRVIEAFNSLAGAIIAIRRLVRLAWTAYRWHTRPTRRP